MSFTGFDKFVWFMGVIEDTIDPYKLNRVRVRCFGLHPVNKAQVRTEDLPWALTTIGNGMHLYHNGDWCVGFFLDGEECQQPLVLGSITGCPIIKQDQNLGFSDPTGAFPRFLNEGTNSRLQRNENIDNTSIGYRRKNIVQNVTTGDGSQWGEPATAYSAIYPYNRVIETPAGHALELDDTPGSARVALYHLAGAFLEFQPDGTCVYRSPGDRYNIVLGDDFLYVAGDVNITVAGDANILTNGDTNLSTGGNVNWRVGQDFNLVVGGNTNVYSFGSILAQTNNSLEVTTANNFDLSIGGAVNLQAGKDVVFANKGDLSLKSDGSAHLEGSGSLGLKSGGVVGVDGSTFSMNEGNSGSAKAPAKTAQPQNIAIANTICYSTSEPNFAPPMRATPDGETSQTGGNNAANSSNSATGSTGTSLPASVQPNAGSFANQVNQATQTAKAQTANSVSGLPKAFNINQGVKSSSGTGNIIAALGGVKAVAAAIGAAKLANTISKAAAAAGAAGAAISTVTNIVTKVINIGGQQKTVQVPPSPLATMVSQYAGFPSASNNTPGIISSQTPQVPRGLTAVQGSSAGVAQGSATGPATNNAVVADPRYRPLGDTPSLPAPSTGTTPPRLPTKVSGADNTGDVNNAVPSPSINLPVSSKLINPNATYVDVSSLDINDAGVNFIAFYEGKRLKAYYDVNGWAIGYGSHQQFVDDQTLNASSTCTAEQALKYLKNGLAKFSAQVKKDIKVPITQGMFNSLVSIYYNAGSASSLVAVINQKNYQQASDMIPTYKATVNGEPYPPLQSRRKAERDMFNA